MAPSCDGVAAAARDRRAPTRTATATRAIVRGCSAATTICLMRTPVGLIRRAAARRSPGDSKTAPKHQGQTRGHTATQHEAKRAKIRARLPGDFSCPVTSAGSQVRSVCPLLSRCIQKNDTNWFLAVQDRRRKLASRTRTNRQASTNPACSRPVATACSQTPRARPP